MRGCRISRLSPCTNAINLVVSSFRAQARHRRELLSLGLRSRGPTAVVACSSSRFGFLRGGPIAGSAALCDPCSTIA